MCGETINSLISKNHNNNNLLSKPYHHNCMLHKKIDGNRSILLIEVATTSTYHNLTCICSFFKG